MPDESTPEGRFAARTRELRKGQGWSQPRLAEEIHSVGGRRLDPSNIARLERGDRRITLDEAHAVAAALHSSVESMIGDALSQVDQERLERIRVAEATVAAAENALLAARRELNRIRGFMPIPSMDDIAELTAEEAEREPLLSTLGPSDVLDQPEEN